ncbi:uncharacterized protein LOC101708543 [Heterocephalus glaber]|uniref:Uncharacterized protein LOC101708543 n=1 Tax=Heterocephalus glaber TaxID=10181 RepID=A0AAX6TA07_HETGA|nr:uncharacterized protein LOC101708543 [Heterocephalus glaber]
MSPSGHLLSPPLGPWTQSWSTVRMTHLARVPSTCGAESASPAGGPRACPQGGGRRAPGAPASGLPRSPAGHRVAGGARFSPPPAGRPAHLPVCRASEWGAWPAGSDGVLESGRPKPEHGAGPIDSKSGLRLPSVLLLLKLERRETVKAWISQSRLEPTNLCWSNEATKQEC